MILLPLDLKSLTNWLGYTWDTENGNIFVKEEGIQKLEKCFTYALCQVEKGKNLISC
jgi:preprotein translocase subunit SecA